MSTLAWIVASGLLMTAIAAVGSVTLLLTEKTLHRLLIPLVAFSAGSLLGGAFFHMLPASLEAGLDPLGAGIAVAAGFTVFFGLEQYLHWHHCRNEVPGRRKPLTYLILIGDGLHNFLGGMAIAGTFLVDVRLGIAAWFAAAAHEIPQEFGDFGVLVHGGWRKGQALLFNMLSGVTFLVGGLVAYALSAQVDVSWLVPFAAGNFIYIGASDLVPEVGRHGEFGGRGVHVLAFVAGLALLLAGKVLL